jgi:isopentenyldiphosphate isomerase
MSEELFPIVDENGTILGSATRSECHSGSFLLHPVVHLHIVRHDGSLLLQKRSMAKDIQPGRWDTAVGGHVDLGENILMALQREAREELGIHDMTPEHLVVYPFKSDREYELVHVYLWHAPTSFVPVADPAEIDEVRFWTMSEIEAAIGTGALTPNFEQEFRRVSDSLK